MELLLMEGEAACFCHKMGSPRGPVHVSLNGLGEMEGLQCGRMQGDHWTEVLEREAGVQSLWDRLMVTAKGCVSMEKAERTKRSWRPATGASVPNPRKPGVVTAAHRRLVIKKAQRDTHLVRYLVFPSNAELRGCRLREASRQGSPGTGFVQWSLTWGRGGGKARVFVRERAGTVDPG